MLAGLIDGQIAPLIVDPHKPLLICDVDDVVVDLTRAFETYISRLGLWRDHDRFAVAGNIRRLDTGAAIARAEIRQLRQRFYQERIRHLEAIEGAVEWLGRIAGFADIVLLSNLPAEAREARQNNLKSHGLTVPLITNSGPKGPAIRALARKTSLPTVFIDNRAICIVSAYEYVPDAHLIHFLHDERLKRQFSPMPFVSLTTGTWREAGEHIATLIGGGRQ
jgi:hypothetical protein